MFKTTLLGFLVSLTVGIFIFFASENNYRYICDEYAINPYLVESIYEHQTNRFRMDKNNISTLLVDYAEAGADVGDGIRAVFPNATSADIESICSYATLLEEKDK